MSASPPSCSTLSLGMAALMRYQGSTSSERRGLGRRWRFLAFSEPDISHSVPLRIRGGDIRHIISDVRWCGIQYWMCRALWSRSIYRDTPSGLIQHYCCTPPIVNYSGSRLCSTCIIPYMYNVWCRRVSQPCVRCGVFCAFNAEMEVPRGSVGITVLIVSIANSHSC